MTEEQKQEIIRLALAYREAYRDHSITRNDYLEDPTGIHELYRPFLIALEKKDKCRADLLEYLQAGVK